MADTMRALVMDRTGDPDVLHLADVARATRVLDEVLVRVVAAGVNPIDAKTRAGRGVSAAIATWPAVLGFDVAGVVEQVPYAAHPWRPGDRVFAMGRVPRVSGSYAELTPVSALSLAWMPESLGFAEAAAVPLAALTAWGAIVEVAQVRPGERVLVHAGAGGVGHLAVQLAAHLGAEVTATGSAESAGFLRSLGAEHVIDYRSERFEAVVPPQDAVIDLIGNVHDRTGTRSLDVVRDGGVLVNVPTGSWPTMAEEAAARGIRATGYVVSADGSILGEIARLIDAGDLRVHVEREFPLAEGADAHRRLEAGHVRGKLVLRVSDDPPERRGAA